MRGFVLYERGKTAIRDVKKPVCGESDIIIKVESAAICGGDVHFYNGTLDLGNYPIVMGHEFAGTIVEMGEKADPYWKLGDRVVSENTYSVCGRCPSCEKGNFVNCAKRRTMGCDENGAFTQYVKVPGELLAVYKNCMFRLPETISMEYAPLLEPASNAYMAVVQEGGLLPGENVVVFGAGALGIYSAQIAAIAGAANVIVVGMESDQATRFPCARKLGATHTIVNNPDVDLEKEIGKICGASGVALVIDAAGPPAVLKQAIQIVRNDGTIVRIGMNDRPLDMGLNIVNVKSVDIKGHMGYNTTSWRNVINLAATGKLDLKMMVTHKLPLTEIQKGFDLLKDQSAIKILIDPEK
ncbi:MAG: alcohol dehydrogenase catalytic domain-containing protein [Eubacteriales bacterium]|nr:alcohol dehydrogenase catalytic domain-containing protein [Eubacteriales bacterium]